MAGFTYYAISRFRTCQGKRIAAAVMAGMKVVNISSRADGCVDLDAATAKKRGVDVKIVKFSVAGNGKSIIENQERKSGAGISYSTKTNITGRRTIFNE